MTDIELFERRWAEAYARERPVIEEAQRMAGREPGLALDPYLLFRLAASRVAASAAFLESLDRVDPPAQFRRRVRAMAGLLESVPRHLKSVFDGPHSPRTSPPRIPLLG